LLLHVTLTSAAELKVDVYDGPKECEESEKVVDGKYLSMHYTGTIDASSATGDPGKKFDSSRDRGETFDVQIGTGQVIEGWDQGLIGLCKGAKATLIIPPSMGYGEEGAGDDIPGGATLNFDVEVVDISDDAPPAENVFAELDTNDDKKLSHEELLDYFKQQGEDSIPEGLMEEVDKDGDGFISLEEFDESNGDQEEL